MTQTSCSDRELNERGRIGVSVGTSLGDEGNCWGMLNRLRLDEGMIRFDDFLEKVHRSDSAAVVNVKC